MFLNVKKFHLVGISGSGMSGLAEILLEKGFQVSGSDLKITEVTKKLISRGVVFYNQHNENNVVNCHAVIVSSAVSESNPEVVQSKKLNIPVIHRSDMLQELMRTKYAICISGTHGKTTTSAIMAETFLHAGYKPSFVVGGTLTTFKSNSKMGAGPLFISEVDESDGSFLKYTPTIAVVTNIDEDHLDHYKNFETIINAFKKFIKKVPFYGCVCLCADNEVCLSLKNEISVPVITYGLNEYADVRAIDIESDSLGSWFTPIVFGKKYPRVRLNLPGSYNVSNACATLAVSYFLNKNITKTSASFQKFKGILHRFTIVAKRKDLIIVDDYAHNPKKIETVIKGTKEAFKDWKVIVVFQPHRYSRVAHQIKEFSKSFSDCDRLIVAPIFSAGEKDIFGVDQNTLHKEICSNSFLTNNSSAFVASSSKHVIEIVGDLIRSDEKTKHIVLTLGAGDSPEIAKSLWEFLKHEKTKKAKKV